MSDLTQRIHNLSPEQRLLLERRLKQLGQSALLPAAPAASSGPATKPYTSVLSVVQEQLVRIDRAHPGNFWYNIPAALYLRGPLQAEPLIQALNAVVRRHGILRTSFGGEDRLSQVVWPVCELAVPLVDLAGLPEAEREPAALQQIAREARQPFDITQAPILRAKLFRLGPDTHILFLCTHYTVCDGWSFSMLIQELAAFYAAHRAGEPAALEELPMQYTDFAAWQRQWLRSPAAQAQLAYWKRQLADAPALALPTDRPRPALRSFRGRRHPVAFPAPLIAQLKTWSRQADTTLFITLLAAYKLLLAGYTGQDDIVVGTGMSSRDLPGTQRVIGRFNDVLLLRTRLDGQPTFEAFVRRVHATAAGAYAHKDLPFDTLLAGLDPAYNRGDPPPLYAMFQLDNASGLEEHFADLTLSVIPIDREKSSADLTLALEDRDEVSGFIEYSTDLFEQAMIERFQRRLHVMLEQIVAHPQERIAWLLERSLSA